MPSKEDPLEYLLSGSDEEVVQRDLQKADKTPKTYDQKVFTLDGRLVMSIEFDGKNLTTPVYLKMDSPDGHCYQKACADNWV